MSGAISCGASSASKCACSPATRAWRSRCERSAAARPRSSSCGGRRLSESWRTRSSVCCTVSTHLVDARARGELVAGARERLQLDLQRGERLADVVVQVARQAPALLFLHFEQAARQRAQPLVRKLELAVQALERLLRAQALGDVVDVHQARGAPAPAPPGGRRRRCRSARRSSSGGGRRRSARRPPRGAGIAEASWSSGRRMSCAVMARNSSRVYP